MTDSSHPVPQQAAAGAGASTAASADAGANAAPARDPAAFETLARAFIESLPHSLALGMQLETIGNGRATVLLPYDEKLVGDPATGIIHGGAVSTLMDTASGAAVMAHPSGPAGTATLDLRIDYMRPATPGQTIRAEAECYHVTRSVAFARVTASDDDMARPVAVASGVFTIEPRLSPRAKAAS